MALHRLAWTDPAPPALTRGAVSVGNFDGVHRGHQNLVKVLRKWAHKVNGPAVVVTFDPPPVALLNPAALRPPLTTIETRAALLQAWGADHVVALTVEPGLLALSAGAFIEEVIQKQLQAHAIVEGSNFAFGRGREGDCRLLGTLEYRANIFFEEVKVDEVSSSRVRAALEAGMVASAHELLGRAYSITGTVVEGAKRGRAIGVPTANLDRIATLIPAPGVYAAKAIVRGEIWNAAVNIGTNPTFGDDARKVEAHLLGFDGELYGEAVTLAFRHKLRDVQRFESADALVAQVKKDIAETAAIMGNA